MGSGNESEKQKVVRNTGKKVRTVYCLTKKVPDENYDLYVGSTSMSLEKRLQSQRTNAKEEQYKGIKVFKRMNEVGLKNWKIVLLLTLECSRDEIRTFERKWCELLEADLNTTSPITSREEALEKKREQSRVSYARDREKIREKQKSYYEKNRERVREQQKSYYEKNCERLREKQKLYYEKNRERALEEKSYYEKNRERALEKKTYHAANREKRKANSASYYTANRAKILEKQKEYRTANRENENGNGRPFLFYESKTRKPAKYFIGGEPQSALKKFPKLIGLLQPKQRIKQKSVEDKFRRFFRRGKLKKEDFAVDAPQFWESNRALDGSFKEFLCDDPIIEIYDLPSLFELLTESIKKVMRENTRTKVYLNLRAKMKKHSDGTEASHVFYSGEFEIFSGTDLSVVIEEMRKVIFKRFEKMETFVGSGWTLLKIQNLKLHFAELKTLRGSSFVELPEWIKNKKAVVNILNTTDNECFKWCITRAIHPIGKHQNKITGKLREQSKIFDWTGVNFPTSFEDISRFQKNNGISVKVLGSNEETKQITHLRNGRYKLAVTLLLFEGHFCLVRNMSRLASQQKTCDNAAYFCDYCSFTHRKRDEVLKQ